MNSCEVVEEETIITSSKKLWTSNEIDGTEDDKIFEVSDNNYIDEDNMNGDINELSNSTECEDKLCSAITNYFNNI